MKTITVTARKLKRGDRVKVGGRMYRITNLNLSFGGERADQVRINLYPLDESHTFNMFSVPSNATFTVRRKK
jgi:hypothetical protein